MGLNLGCDHDEHETQTRYYSGVGLGLFLALAGQRDVVDVRPVLQEHFHEVLEPHLEAEGARGYSTSLRASYRGKVFTIPVSCWLEWNGKGKGMLAGMEWQGEG